MTGHITPNKSCKQRLGNRPNSLKKLIQCSAIRHCTQKVISLQCLVFHYFHVILVHGDVKFVKHHFGQYLDSRIGPCESKRQLYKLHHRKLIQILGKWNYCILRFHSLCTVISWHLAQCLVHSMSSVVCNGTQSRLAAGTLIAVHIHG